MLWGLYCLSGWRILARCGGDRQPPPRHHRRRYSKHACNRYFLMSHNKYLKTLRNRGGACQSRWNMLYIPSFFKPVKCFIDKHNSPILSNCQTVENPVEKSKHNRGHSACGKLLDLWKTPLRSVPVYVILKNYKTLLSRGGGGRDWSMYDFSHFIQHYIFYTENLYILYGEFLILFNIRTFTSANGKAVSIYFTQLAMVNIQ